MCGAVAGILRITLRSAGMYRARSSRWRSPVSVTDPMQSARFGKRLTKTSKALLATSLRSSGVSSPKRSVGVPVQHETTNKAANKIADNPLRNEPIFQRFS